MKLSNHRLSVTVADPAAIETQRFDRTALIEQVVLDGKYTFCTPEQMLPGRRTTFGVGLAGEFVLEGAAEQAKAGELFVKPGVGLMEQLSDNAPYDIWKNYPLRPLAVTARQRGEIGRAHV